MELIFDQTILWMQKKQTIEKFQNKINLNQK